MYREHHPNLQKEIEQEFDRGCDGVKEDFPRPQVCDPVQKESWRKTPPWREGSRSHTGAEEVQHSTLEGAGRGGAHDIEVEEVQR